MTTATIFTTKTCAFCPMVAKWLDKEGIKFTKVELDDNPSLRNDLLKRTGAMTVPITMIEKKINRATFIDYVVGWDPAKLAKAVR